MNQFKPIAIALTGYHFSTPLRNGLPNSISLKELKDILHIAYYSLGANSQGLDFMKKKSFLKQSIKEKISLAQQKYKQVFLLIKNSEKYGIRIHCVYCSDLTNEGCTVYSIPQFKELFSKS